MSIDETKVIENVPDALAGSIPRVLLVPQESVNVTLINQKQWTQEQVRHVPVSFVFIMMEEEKHCKISQSIAVCLCVYADFRSCGWLIRR